MCDNQVNGSIRWVQEMRKPQLSMRSREEGSRNI